MWSGIVVEVSVVVGIMVLVRVWVKVGARVVVMIMVSSIFFLARRFIEGVRMRFWTTSGPAAGGQSLRSELGGGPGGGA